MLVILSLLRSLHAVASLRKQTCEERDTGKGKGKKGCRKGGKKGSKKGGKKGSKKGGKGGRKGVRKGEDGELLTDDTNCNVHCESMFAFLFCVSDAFDISFFMFRAAMLSFPLGAGKCKQKEGEA